MKKLSTIFFGAALMAGICPAGAQTQGAIQQVDTVQQRRQLEQAAQTHETGESAPELFPGESSDVGTQSVLKVKPRRTWIEAMGDVQYFYTDNMFLNEDHRQSADVLVSTVQIAVAPTAYDLIGGKIAPRVGFRQQWFNYGLASDKRIDVFDFNTSMFKSVHLNEFDFNAQTIFGDGRWTHGNWAVEAGVDYARLMNMDYEQFYDELVPRVGLQRIFPLCEKAAFAVGYAGDYRFTGTDLPPPGIENDFNDRTDHSLFASLNVAICPRVAVQPFYRFTYTHFTSGIDRDDTIHAFGVALSCAVTRQLSVRGFVGYNIAESSGTQAADDYERLDAGGGVNVTLRF